jgi:hypothetical protein
MNGVCSPLSTQNSYLNEFKSIGLLLLYSAVYLTEEQKCVQGSTQNLSEGKQAAEKKYMREDNIKLDLKNKMGVCGLNSHCSR